MDNVEAAKDSPSWSSPQAPVEHARKEMAGLRSKLVCFMEILSVAHMCVQTQWASHAGKVHTVCCFTLLTSGYRPTFWRVSSILQIKILNCSYRTPKINVATCAQLPEMSWSCIILLYQTAAIYSMCCAFWYSVRYSIWLHAQWREKYLLSPQVS